MKFGVPIYEYKSLKAYGENLYNIGDYIQSYAIYEFYRSIGIGEQDIVFVTIEDLSEYSGPYLVVLLNMYGGLLDFNFSPRIIPVFWGFSYAGYIGSQAVSVLKAHEPIGCRDATTLYNVRSAGIKAFLSGCITMTLEARSNEIKGYKYFFVDTPSELDDFIPKEVVPKMEKRSHLITCELPFSKELALFNYNKAVELLKDYKSVGAVVVTGRLHCASPCIAMGVPVIIAKKNKDTNMGWIERASEIYTPDNFKTINWRPVNKNINDLKLKMRLSAQRMIQNIMDFSSDYDLSYEFEESVRETNDFLVNNLRNVVKKLRKDNFCYAIWGLGDGGGIAFRLINKEYPGARCIVCVDTYKDGDFYDMEIHKPESIGLYLESLDYIFVTTYSGRKEAVEYLRGLGLIQNENFCFLISRVNGEDEYFKLNT